MDESKGNDNYKYLSALLTPGEKVQIDVKEALYSCLKVAVKQEDKHLYQWTAIDECTRIRFIYSFEEHPPENSVKFLKMLRKVFSFKIQTIQTDNSTEFACKYISDDHRYFYDWKKFRSVEELNEKLREHLHWSNRKTMRTLTGKFPCCLTRYAISSCILCLSHLAPMSHII